MPPLDPTLNTADTGFTRALAGQTGAALSSLQPDDEGLKEFSLEDFDPQNDVSVFDSFSSAFADSGIITGGIRALADPGPSALPDPQYDLEAHLQSQPEDLKFVQTFLDSPMEPSSGSLLSRLADSQNTEQTDHIIRQAREAKARIDEAIANGWFPYLAGTLSGVGLDIAAAVGLSALTGGSATPAVATRGALAGRALATGRLAALGTIESGGERFVQKLTNPLIADIDVLEAAGFGAGAGAILGFAFPTLLGNVKRIRTDLAEPVPLTDELIDEAREVSGRGTAGAARAPDADIRVVEPARGSGSLVAGRAAPKGLQESALRNPKRVIVDIGAKAARDFRDKGLQGGRVFFDTMARTVRLSTVMADEVNATAARGASVQDIRDQFRVIRLAREEAANREYAETMKSVFGVGGIRRALRNSALVNAEKHLISQEQFEAMADELAIAKGEGILGEVDIVPDEIARRLTPEQRDNLMSRLEATAAAEDDYYQKFGQLEIKHGLIKEEDLIPGYRPQRWNRGEIEADPQGFQQYLLEVFSKEPDEDWIRASFAGRKEDGTLDPVLKEGETFAQLSRRDPELANEILDEWGAAIKQQAEESVFEVRAVREKELKKIRGKAAVQVNDRLIQRLEQAQTLYTRLEARLATTQDEAARATLATRLTKIEKRIADQSAKLEAFHAATRNADAMDEFIRRFGNVGQKRAIGKALKRVNATVKKEARVQARKIVSEQIAAIRRAILDGNSPFGFVDAEFIQSSARFKRRNIRLGTHRFRPEARRFLHTSSHDARAAFDSSVGTQIAMREIFGPILEREGEKFSLETLRASAMRGYDDDLRKATDDATRGRITRERKRAQRIFDHIFEELTHADLASLRGVRKDISDLVSITNTATAAMSLGSVVMAQFGDIAVQILAGGRLGTGFRFMWRRNVIGHLREIAKNEDELAVLIQGPSVVDASRFRSIAEIDQTGFDIPGSRFRRVMRATDEVAKIEGWANLMHVWNTIVRGGFGLDFARQIDRDLANFSKLPAHLRTYYAKIGIDDEIARDMADLMDRAHRKAVNGKLRIPHSSKWADERPDLLMRYRMAIKSAGDEAMIDPGVADRPFLRSYPGGRLLLQFQSFMFTAGERFIAPLIQELQLHPTSIRPYIAALAGLFLGAMTDGLKASVRGEFEPWANNWSDSEGWKDNMWGAVLRSPLMGGPSATLVDVGMSAFGRVINDRMEDVTGVRPLRQEAARFRENQGLFALAGPAAGTLLGTVPAIARRFIDGDVDEAAAMTARRLPIANVFYIHMLTRIASDD